MATPKKTRMGARGVAKVKSGCQTCKIRHKKCGEARPACYECSSTGRQCDFMPHPSPRPITGWNVNAPLGAKFPVRSELQPSTLPRYMDHQTSFEVTSFDYFRVVCAVEFGLFFEMPSWGGFVLQMAHTEPSIYHAALAISTLSRCHYAPQSYCGSPGDSRSILEYFLVQYNQAIRKLNARLERSAESAELAILASVLFINIEFLQAPEDRGRLSSFMTVHLKAALAILGSLKSRAREVDYLEAALCKIQRQLT